MLKLDYFRYAIQQQLYLQRGWLLSVMGILPTTTDEHSYATTGIKSQDGVVTVKVNNTDTVITDYKHQNQPLYGRDERVNVRSGDMRCIKQDLLTTYGLLVANALIIEYPYGGLVNYLNEEFTEKLLNRVGYDAITDDRVTIDMHHRFENAISQIKCLAQTIVPSASRRSISANPKVAELKPQLLKEYAGRLLDPASIAELQSKLSKIDDEYLKGDPSERFFISRKPKMSRLRTEGMYGAEQDFIDESKISVMENSLSEGWKVKDLPMMANNIRGGSINRGINTALGGVTVKEVARIFQNYTVNPNDCLATHGLTVQLTADNAKNYVGRYLLTKSIPLTAEDCKHHIGKSIVIRSPTYCLSPGASICKICIGDTIANSGIGINALMMGMSSTFLSLFMAAMHTSALSTQRYNHHNRITWVFI